MNISIFSIAVEKELSTCKENNVGFAQNFFFNIENPSYDFDAGDLSLLKEGQKFNLFAIQPKHALLTQHSSYESLSKFNT